MKTCKDCPFHNLREVTTRTVSKKGVTTKSIHWCNYRNHEVARVMRCYVVDNPTRYMERQQTQEIIVVED